MCWLPRTRRNISEMFTVSPGRAYVSGSLNFGRWSGWRRLAVPASSSNTRGLSIPASARTRSWRAVDCWSVDTRL